MTTNIGSVRNTDALTLKERQLHPDSFSTSDNSVPENMFGDGQIEAFTGDTQELLDQFSAAQEAAGVSADQAAEAPQASSGVAATDAEVERIKQEKADREKEREDELDEMEKIEDKIEELNDSAQDHIEAAKAKQEEMVEEHQEEAEKIYNEEVANFVKENKEATYDEEGNKEGGMTTDKLKDNIDGKLDALGLPNSGSVISELSAANTDVNQMDAHLADLNDDIQDVKTLNSEIASLDEQQKAAEEAAAAAAKSGCCDPIGFVKKDENGNEIRYDFIVDDGNFDTTSDFLGAQNNWEEMEALDGSVDGKKDGKVDAAELEAANIKAVKTDAEGNQTTVDFASEFGEDFSIDLSSYQKGGSHDAVDTSNGDQELLGTFDVNIGDETISGYNTLDDTNFLEETYSITNDVEEATEEVDDPELQKHIEFFNKFTQYASDKRTEISEMFQNLGVTAENIENINETTKADADAKAKQFMVSLGATETDANKEAKEAEEGDDANEPETVAEETDKEVAIATTTVTEIDETTGENELETSDMSILTEKEKEEEEKVLVA